MSTLAESPYDQANKSVKALKANRVRFYVGLVDVFVGGGSVPRHSWYSRPFGVTVIILDAPSYVTKWCASNASNIACRSCAEGTIGKKNES